MIDETERLAALQKQYEALTAANNVQDEELRAASWRGFQSRFHALASFAADKSFRTTGVWDQVSVPETVEATPKALLALERKLEV